MKTSAQWYRVDISYYTHNWETRGGRERLIPSRTGQRTCPLMGPFVLYAYRTDTHTHKKTLKTHTHTRVAYKEVFWWNVFKLLLAGLVFRSVKTIPVCTVCLRFWFNRRKESCSYCGSHWATGDPNFVSSAIALSAHVGKDHRRKLCFLSKELGHTILWLSRLLTKIAADFSGSEIDQILLVSSLFFWALGTVSLYDVIS